MLTVLMIAAALPAAAQAQQWFDFNGQVTVPADVGGVLAMNSVVFDSPPATTPIPLDFDNYEYTIVIDGLVLDSVDGITQTYSGGTITLYEDASTPADYADGSTFTDGAVVLSGVITTLDRTVFTATLGTVNGFVDWTGGDHLNDMAPLDQLGWPFLSGINSTASYVQPGYDENWDGKVEPTVPIVASETMSWGDLKRQF
jgi:hypothetical protein